MRREKGITLVALVVTIIVLIILAGVSINLVLGENGIITRAKQAKTKAEQATLNEQTALNELYVQMEAEDMGLGGISYDAIAKIKKLENKFSDLQNEFNNLQSEYSTFKTAIADAVTDMGVPTANNADATTMASNIRSLSGVSSSNLVGNLIFVPGTAGAVNSINLTDIFPDTYGGLRISDFSDLSVDCRQSWGPNGRNNIVLSYDNSTGILTGSSTITQYASGVLVYPVYLIKDKTFHKISACSDSVDSAVVDCSYLSNYKSLSNKNFVSPYVYWESIYDAYKVKRCFGSFSYNKENGQLTISKEIYNSYQNSVGNFEIGVIY